MSAAPETNTDHAEVDPRAPRFGQALTAALLAVGIGLGQPGLVYLVAVILGVAVVSRWHIDLYGLLWRHGISRFVSPPSAPEPAGPHRFAKLLGATGTAVASVLLFVGATAPGMAIAGAVSALAALAATTGLCLGCRLYRQVSFLKQHDVV